MDVTGTLVKCVLPQPVHHPHHALVVGVERFLRPAHFHQLLKVGNATGRARLLGGAHRFGQRKKLGHVALNLQRARQYPAHWPSQLTLKLGYPIGDIGLGGGHHHLGGCDLDGKYVVTAVGRTVQLWGMEEEWMSFTFDDEVKHCAISGNGRVVAVVDLLGRIHLLRVVD